MFERDKSEFFWKGGSPACGRYRGSECDSSFERDKVSCMSGGAGRGLDSGAVAVELTCFESDTHRAFLL